MEKVTAFFQMGGYAAFVWPSLGLTVAVMSGLLIATLRQLRGRQRRLAELEAAGAQRRRRAASPPAAPPGETREARP
ncbi:MAG: heme exporter protein CcmD [Kiloniellaceae bacterium]|jgi:heme exporter protein D|nr:heme exporter protein CcmD [Kiloniellaceae bacterium]